MRYIRVILRRVRADFRRIPYPQKWGREPPRATIRDSFTPQRRDISSILHALSFPGGGRAQTITQSLLATITPRYLSRFRRISAVFAISDVIPYAWTIPGKVRFSSVSQLSKESYLAAVGHPVDPSDSSLALSRCNDGWDHHLKVANVAFRARYAPRAARTRRMHPLAVLDRYSFAGCGI